MKKLRFVLPLFMCVMFFSSCNDFVDGDESEDWWLTTGTVVVNDNSFYIITDDGLKFGQKDNTISASAFEDGMRLLFYYEVEREATDSELIDYYIELKDYDEILTKPIFSFTEETTQEVIDSIGESPIHIVDTWFTDDYLNVQFEYYGYNMMHYVNLVYDSENPTSENGEILLELKHNDNGDYWNEVQWGIASFDISQLQIEGESSVDIYVRSWGYYDEYEYNKVLTYDYSTENISSQTGSFFNKYKNLSNSVIE